MDRLDHGRIGELRRLDYSHYGHFPGLRLPPAPTSDATVEEIFHFLKEILQIRDGSSLLVSVRIQAIQGYFRTFDVSDSITLWADAVFPNPYWIRE